MNSTPSLQQTFPEPVNIPTVLAQRQIDHIDVSDTRLLVIYMNAVLNIKVCTGTIDAAQMVDIEILDDPHRVDTDLELLLSNFSDLLHSR